MQRHDRYDQGTHGVSIGLKYPPSTDVLMLLGVLVTADDQVRTSWAEACEDVLVLIQR